MKILSITAQKPHSTGSGVYLTELVNAFDRLGHSQAVIAGICKEDTVHFPDRVSFFPVYYQSASLPFPVAGMSDEMPYESTRYRDMTPEMTGQFCRAFSASIIDSDHLPSSVSADGAGAGASALPKNRGLQLICRAWTAVSDLFRKRCPCTAFQGSHCRNLPRL